MNENPDAQPVDAGLVKYLRLLVTILTGTMILGFLVIVFLFVTKFSNAFGPDLPDAIVLPEGANATAFTQGDGWYAIVTSDNQILIYDLNTKELRQTIQIEER